MLTKEKRNRYLHWYREVLKAQIRHPKFRILLCVVPLQLHNASLEMNLENESISETVSFDSSIFSQFINLYISSRTINHIAVAIGY